MSIFGLLNHLFTQPKPHPGKLKRMEKRGEKWAPKPNFVTDEIRMKSFKLLGRMIDRKIRNLHKQNSVVNDGDVLVDKQGKRVPSKEKLEREKTISECILILERIKKLLNSNILNPGILQDLANFLQHQNVVLKDIYIELKSIDNYLSKYGQNRFDEGYTPEDFMGLLPFKFIKIMIEMNYLSSDEKARKEQLATVRKWVEYLRHTPIVKNNKYIILRMILGHTKYFMDRENEKFDPKGVRKNKGNNLDFPQFDGDLTPQIVGVFNGLLTVYTRNMSYPKQDSIQDLLNNTNGDAEMADKVYQAIENKDLRELYFLATKVVDTTFFDENLVEKKLEGTWLPVFSFKIYDSHGNVVGEKPDSEKEKIALEVAKKTANSKFCLKGYQTAYDYLKEGDLYLYQQDYLMKDFVEENGVKKQRLVPRATIGIHVKPDGKINEKEVHGNGENQGIEKDFLATAREFVTQKKTVVGEDGKEKEVYRFSNAEVFETKFADTIMYNKVKDKIKSLVKGERNEDLSPDELKFLYQVYRKVQTFELGSGHFQMENLQNRRYQFLRLLAESTSHDRYPISQKEWAKLVKRRDYERMFGVEDHEIYILGNKVQLQHPEKIKIFVGDFVHFLPSLANFTGLVEITGKIFLNYSSVNRKTTFFKNIKRINGVDITDEIRDKLNNGTLEKGYSFLN